MMKGSRNTFRIGDQVYRRVNRPYIMGILNVTPDSFSDGGEFYEIDAAVERAIQMVQQGADFIDVGGESSRPGADPVPCGEEIRRVIPVIQKLALKIEIPISIDTTKAEVAQEALSAGAIIVNDISALRSDADMARVVAENDAALVLMHMKGEPHNMQDDPYYDNVIDEIYHFLSARIEVALKAGIQKERIIIDPGIGFGKRVEDNLDILAGLNDFTDLGPVLVGPSRKSFIGYLLDAPVADRLFGTAASVAVATLNGADIIRVHDVGEMWQVVEIAGLCARDTKRPATV